MDQLEQLRGFLLLAVPLKIAHLERQGGPNETQWQYVREHNVSQKADELIYGSSQEQARLARECVYALAVLAFKPGGVRAFGCHFQSNRTPLPATENC